MDMGMDGRKNELQAARSRFHPLKVLANEN
jgi:hypothetical protein